VAGIADVMPHVETMATAINGDRTAYVGLPSHTRRIGDNAGRTGQIVGTREHVNDVSGMRLPVNVIECATWLSGIRASTGIDAPC
jgi:hypothetical protein